MTAPAFHVPAPAAPFSAPPVSQLPLPAQLPPRPPPNWQPLALRATPVTAVCCALCCRSGALPSHLYQASCPWQLAGARVLRPQRRRRRPPWALLRDAGPGAQWHLGSCGGRPATCCTTVGDVTCKGETWHISLAYSVTFAVSQATFGWGRGVRPHLSPSAFGVGPPGCAAAGAALPSSPASCMNPFHMRRLLPSWSGLLGVLLVALATRLLLSFRTHAAQSSSANANTVKASGAASLPPPDEEPLKRVLPRGLSIVLSAYGLRGEDPANEYMLFACACPQLPGLGLERGLCCSNCTAILFDTF